MLVPTSVEGIPKSGVTRVGEVLITTLPVPVTAFEITFLLASVNKACEAVVVESTGAAPNVLTPVTVCVVVKVISPVAALTQVGASAPFD